jgi:hypothetical protein
MDPRLKLQYYIDNQWEEPFIQDARSLVTNLWETTYKVNNTEVEESSADDSDDIFGRIFKKQKIDDRDELKLYLNEKIASGKTDVLLWWKVY